MGRLSNPRESFVQAVALLPFLMRRPDRPPIRRPGRQAQRRLEPSEVAALIRQRTTCATIAALASEFAIHRTTVIGHLQRASTKSTSPRKGQSR